MDLLNREQPQPEMRPLSENDAKRTGLPMDTIAQIDPESGVVCFWCRNERGRLVAPLIGLKKNLRAKEKLRRMWAR